MSESSRLHLRRTPDGFAVSGELDAYTAPSLREHVADFLRANHTVRLDLSGVEFIDSSGLGVLVAARRLTDERAGSLVIETPSANVSRLLELSGLSSYLTIVTT